VREDPYVLSGMMTEHPGSGVERGDGEAVAVSSACTRWRGPGVVHGFDNAGKLPPTHLRTKVLSDSGAASRPESARDAMVVQQSPHRGSEFHSGPSWHEETGYTSCDDFGDPAARERDHRKA